jgi:hypothetical protein
MAYIVCGKEVASSISNLEALEIVPLNLEIPF